MLCGREDVRRKLCSMLDPEDSAETKIGSSFPKFFLLPLAMLIVVGALLFLAFSASEQKEDNFYSFKVVNIRGKLVSLDKYRGSVSLRRRESLLPPTNQQVISACLHDGRGKRRRRTDLAGRVCGMDVLTGLPAVCDFAPTVL